MNKLYFLILLILALISVDIRANNDSTANLEPIIAEECESDTSRLFPDYGSIDKYFLDMLNEGTPRNGSFSTSASQLVSEYHSAPIINYKDFLRIYTFTDIDGIEKSVDLILRVHETVSAGTSRELVISPTDPPFKVLDSLGGNPSLSGSWNNLTNGIFDPAIDPSGVYTYVVPSGSCTDTAYLTIVVTDNSGDISNKTYASYSDLSYSNENFVYTRSPRIPVQNSAEIEKENELMEQITYFDGLGRPKQTIGIRAGGDLEDLVTPMKYDAFGRQVKEYLPYATASQDGQIMPNPLPNVTSFYNTEKYENTPNPYSEKSLEASPLDRVLEQGAPGAPWALGGGHGIKFAYQTNAANEVRLLEVIFENGDYRFPELSEDGFYAAGSLYKTITYDEEHASGKNHSTEEFKDKQGRVVLKRSYADTDTQAEDSHDTYYVYDDYGNLSYVLPPKMEATTASLVTLTDVIPELGYQYKYDHRNRLVEKQLPGKDWEYIVYNVLDQPILTQDALQRESDSWLYTKYDALGRVVQTGIYIHGTPIDQEGMQGVVTTFEESVPTYESKSGSSYTNHSFPTSNKEMLIENYYDSYTFDHSGISIPGNNTYGITIVSDKVQGLATGSRVKVLETTNWITTVNGYDDKGRSIWNATKNDFLATTDVIESELDFVGNTLRQTTTHQKTDVPEDIITEDIFTYDHMNRMLAHTQTINGGDEELLAHNTYDEMGQLTTKGIGFGTEPVESEDDFLETTYTGIVNAIINPDGSIAKTGSGEEEGYVETEQEFSQDGYVQFTPYASNRLFSVGLTYEDPDYIDSDFHYYSYVVGNYIRTYEGGSEGWFSPRTQTPVAPGDTITVERIGYKIYYKKNGETFYVSPHISAGKLKGKVKLSDAGTNGTSVGYVELHKLDRKTKYLQEINYAYNIRGWLKSINNPENLGEDLFGFKLGYNDPEISAATPLFNGNISEIQWNSQFTNSTSNSVSKHYTYRYDALNRITSATDNTGHYDLSGIGYDKMGNILSLQRQGPIDDQITSFGVMDNLAYNYNGSNQLMQVADASLETQGFNDGNSGIDYGYDVNGNLTSDLNKGILAGGIKYNHLNLPTEVKFNNSSSQVIKYTYDATGVKLRKEIPNKITDYAGNFVYEQLGTGSKELQFFSTPEGYVSYDNGQFNYVYNYVDHLGNVRLSYTDGDHNGSIDPATEIIQEKNYYPFGLTHEGYNGAGGGIAYGNAAANRYGFGGKELQDETFSGNTLDWYDISARNYDSALGRWMNVDPLAEKYFEVSNYSYALNNPIFYIDPDGQKVWVYYQQGEEEQRAEYRDGKFYNEDNEVIDTEGNDFLTNSLESLNQMNSTKIGSSVLGDLVDSKYDFNLKNKKTGEKNTAGFIANKDKDGNYTGGGDFALSESQDLETISHEVFHAYQYENGTGGANINNEVEAYIFGVAVDTQYAFDNGGLASGLAGRSNEAGQKFSNAANDLLFSNKFNINSFKTAVNNFKGGSTKNSTGIYNKFPVLTINPKKILLSNFYPLIR